MNPATMVALVRSNLRDRWGPASWLQPAWRSIAAEVALQSGAFLDLSSGHGWVCIHVAAGKPELDAVGIEPCETRREQADRNRQRRLNCTFKAMDLHELTYPDDTFDVVVAISSAHRWPDARAVLAEIHRVLKPNGRFLIYDPRPDADIPQGWIERRGAWPPKSVVRQYLQRHAMTDEGWETLKRTVKESPFQGGEEGEHGFYRRLVLRGN